MSPKNKPDIPNTPPSTGYSTKMRIRKFGGDGLLIEDRLVEQLTELRVGPKEEFKGVYSLEFTLQSAADVDGVISYIRKLRGDLPIEAPSATKKSSTTNKLDKMLSEKEPLEDLLNTVRNKSRTQEELVNTLREYNFMFVTDQLILDLADEKQISLSQKHIERGFQYMVRRIKEAKDPANDKFDWRLVFAIKVIGDRLDYVPVYLWGKKEKNVLKLPWANKKQVNFKKVDKVYKFPEMMDYTERKKWRLENTKVMRAQEQGVEFEQSKFYKKWAPYIVNPNDN